VTTIKGFKDLGRCGVCRQLIREAPSGSIVGHTSNCPRKDQAP
jgi:hypothetical protein